MRDCRAPGAPSFAWSAEHAEVCGGRDYTTASPKRAPENVQSSRNSTCMVMVYAPWQVSLIGQPAPRTDGANMYVGNFELFGIWLSWPTNRPVIVVPYPA